MAQQDLAGQGQEKRPSEFADACAAICDVPHRDIMPVSLASTRSASHVRRRQVVWSAGGSTLLGQHGPS
jgi:hypothetical protein